MKILDQNRKKNKNTGFTITEVIIATLIFSLAMAGVFASISQLRQPAVESSQEVTAAFLGKKILDDLRGDVNQDTWNSGNLVAGTTYGPYTQTIGGKAYFYSYDVIADPDGTRARQVTLNVTW